MALPSIRPLILAGLTALAALALPLPAFATVTNGMNASYVLGQSTFTSSGSATTQSGMYTPDGGSAFDVVHHRLFVVDSNNNRVLVFDLSSGITNGMNAAYVLGQPDFTSSNSALTQSSMSCPEGLAYDADHSRLFVQDQCNDRVLIFDLSNGITNGMNASNVLGEPDFTSDNGGAATQAGVNGPYGNPVYDSAHQRLFLPDLINNRVLIFDLSNGITNGMNASYVLGQADFTSHTNATTQSGIGRPLGLAYDSDDQRLFVPDFQHNRILVFDLSSGISNGMNASYVLGQSTFTSNTSATTQSGFTVPSGPSYDAQNKRLFVPDQSNNRILIFDLSSGITNGMNASSVLGQDTFIASGSATTQSGMSNPNGLFFDPTTARLFVLDSGNNRLLVFDVCPTESCVQASSSSSSSSSSTSSAAPQQHSGGHRGHGTDLTEALSMNTEQQHLSSSASPAAASSSSVASASPQALRSLLTQLRHAVATCHPRTSACTQQIQTLRSDIRRMRGMLRRKR